MLFVHEERPHLALNQSPPRRRRSLPIPQRPLPNQHEATLRVGSLPSDFTVPIKVATPVPTRSPPHSTSAANGHAFHHIGSMNGQQQHQDWQMTRSGSNNSMAALDLADASQLSAAVGRYNNANTTVAGGY
jgi:hypothetical protein